MAERANQAICTGAVQAGIFIIREAAQRQKTSGYAVNKSAGKSEGKPDIGHKSAC